MVSVSVYHATSGCVVVALVDRVSAVLPPWLPANGARTLIQRRIGGDNHRHAKGALQRGDGLL